MQYKLILTRALVALVAVLAFVFIAPSAFAEEATSTPDREALRERIEERRDAVRDRLEEKRSSIEAKRAEFRSNVEDRREEVRLRLEEKREAVRARFQEHVEARINAYIERMAERLRAAVERLEGFAERIDSRIAKLEERGVDVSESKRLLGIAEEKTAQASVDVEAAIEMALDIPVSEKPREAFKAAKEALREAKQSLHEALLAFRDVVVSLKVAAGLSDDDSVDSDE